MMMYFLNNEPLAALCLPGETATDDDVAQLQRAFDTYYAHTPEAFEQWTNVRNGILNHLAISSVDHDTAYVLCRSRAEQIFAYSTELQSEVAGSLVEIEDEADIPSSVILLHIDDPTEKGKRDGARIPASTETCGNYHTHPSVDKDAIPLPSARDMVTFMRQHLDGFDFHSAIFTQENGDFKVYVCTVQHAVAITPPTRSNSRRARSQKHLQYIQQYFQKIENMFLDNASTMPLEEYKHIFVLACRYLGGLFALYETTPHMATCTERGTYQYHRHPDCPEMTTDPCDQRATRKYHETPESDTDVPWK